MTDDRRQMTEPRTSVRGKEERVHAGVKRLREKADLVPEPLRDWWLNYLNGHLERYTSVISRLPAPEHCGRLLEIGCVDR